MFNQEINLSSLAWGSLAVLAKVRESKSPAGTFFTSWIFTVSVVAILTLTESKGVSEHAVTFRITGEAVVS